MNALQKAIESRGYTVKSIADKAGIPATNLYNITSGRGKLGNMGINSFIKLARALGMTADELIVEIEENERDED